MAQYLDKAKQAEMAVMIRRYTAIIGGAPATSREAERIMSRLFPDYVDKIINGIIYTPKYSFWRYAEIDDLIQEGRMAIMTSIWKEQWKQDRGSIFNFFSTVIARNLMNYTTKHNRNYKMRSSADISELNDADRGSYNQNMDAGFLIDDLRRILFDFFKGRKRLTALAELLVQYWEVNSGEKFVKKQFTEFARTYNFSPAVCNTFFELLKRASKRPDVRELLEIINRENLAAGKAAEEINDN